MHIDPLRITHPALKAVAVVFGALVLLAGSFFLYLVFRTGALVLLPLVALLLIYLATRVFRSAGERVAPPRAWWRATGRPIAGFVIAGLTALWSVAPVLRIAFGGALNVEAIGELFVAAVVITFFVHSSIRLLRGGQGEDVESRSAPEPRERSLAKPFRFREFD